MSVYIYSKYKGPLAYTILPPKMESVATPKDSKLERLPAQYALTDAGGSVGLEEGRALTYPCP